MLFYKTTNVIADQNILKQLLQFFGPEKLIELLDENLLKIIYTESFTGIHTNTINGGIQLHRPVVFSSPQHTFQEVIRRHCIALTGKEGKGRRTARRIERSVTVIHHEKELTEGAHNTLLDQSYLKIAIPILIKSLVPGIELNDNIEFVTEGTDKDIRVHTNLDFHKLNVLYHKHIPPSHSSLSSASVLSHLFNVESDLYFSSTYLSELATSSLNSRLLKEKLGYLIDRGLKSQQTIKQFQDFIFDDSKSLREAVNTNKVDIVETIDVIKKAAKFKDWLTEQDINNNLIKEYYKEVTKESFIDKLPGKSTRWAIFTGLGLAADSVATGGIGTTLGVSLGALDTFFIDKLLKGWNPSQFIEEDFKNLLNKDT